MDLSPVSSPPPSPRSSKSDPLFDEHLELFDESLELAEGSRPLENFGSSTITSASTTPVTAPIEQQAACCLTRCLSYLGEQISDFFDWVCSLFVSSKPATKENIEAAMKEVQILMKQLSATEQLSKERYKNLDADLSDQLDSVKRRDNVYLYFADAIEQVSLLIIITETSVRWGRYQTRRENHLRLDGDQIITERRLRLDKKKLIGLYKELVASLHMPCARYSSQQSKAIVEAFCLGRKTSEKAGENYALIDLIDQYPEISIGFGLLEKEFQKIISEKRDPLIAQFKKPVEKLTRHIEIRYKQVTVDKIQGDKAIALLADAIDIFTCYDMLLKGDISDTSVIEKRLQKLESDLDPSNPIFKPVTPEMRKAVTYFDFTSPFVIDRSRGTIVDHIFWYQPDREIGRKVRDSLNTVINELQKLPATMKSDVP